MSPAPTDSNTDPDRPGADSRFLRSLVGYNTRRATLHIFELFHQRMRAHRLNPVEFSVLSLIGHNPGLTVGQIGQELALPAPALAKLLARLGQQGWVVREALPTDRRAFVLSLSESGQQQLDTVEPLVSQLEIDATAMLSTEERALLNDLLQRIYRSPPC